MYKVYFGLQQVLKYSTANRQKFNPLTPNDDYSNRTAPLTSKFTFYIFIQQISTEYFKHGVYCPLFSLQNAVCFIILTYLVPVLFTFYIFIQQISTEYFKHGIYCPFFSLQNAVCFIILTYLVPVLFTFYIFIQQI